MSAWADKKSTANNANTFILSCLCAENCLVISSREIISDNIGLSHETRQFRPSDLPKRQQQNNSYKIKVAKQQQQNNSNN